MNKINELWKISIMSIEFELLGIVTYKSGLPHVSPAFLRAILVWVRLKRIADQTCRTIYDLKKGLMSEYVHKQLRNPNINMEFA